MLEALFQIVGEFLLQILFEAAVEVGFHCLKRRGRIPANPIVLTIGYLGWGVLVGGLSLLVFPHSFIANAQLRLINVIVTPFLAGAAIMFLGRVRKSRGQDLVRLDQFGYAFAFALAMALIRYFLTKSPV